MVKLTGKLNGLSPVVYPGPAQKPAGARAVGSYVARLTRAAFEKYGFASAALLTDWARIVGNDIAGKVRPEKLKWPRGVESCSEAGTPGRPGATLVVRTDPAFAFDIEYQARLIIERINAYFGYRAVAELRLVQCPFETPVPNQAVLPAPNPDWPQSPEQSLAETVTDESLRAALLRLDASIRSGHHSGH
jgi:hypothetical protein